MMLFDLDKITAMSEPIRVTGPLLDVLEVFLRAFDEDAELHGWAIMKLVKRSGPTVYGVLDRLEDAGWVTGRWEERHPEPSKPRRRFYRLTPDGAVAVRRLVSDRRPAALRRPPQARPELALLIWVHGLLPGGTR
jgi:PadR family transcriptional regulator PadR